MLLQMVLFHYFLWLSNIALYIIPHLLYPFIHLSIGSFHVLAIVNSAAMNIGVHADIGFFIFSTF